MDAAWRSSRPRRGDPAGTGTLNPDPHCMTMHAAYAGPVTSVGIIGPRGSPGPSCCASARHIPDLDVRLATGDTQAGGRRRPLPQPRRRLPRPDLRAVRPADAATASTSCSSACPTAPPRTSCPSLAGQVGTLVDLAADFRLQDAALYPQWYGEEHTPPELLADFAYGLPELFRDRHRGAARVAAPGCYSPRRPAGPGAARAGRAGRADRDRRRRRAGCRAPAGRPSRHHLLHVDEDFTAYGLLDHRHTPEIEQAIGPRCCSPRTWPR